jgi:multisubunit Na+/H+ antiporter MnhB subunit
LVSGLMTVGFSTFALILGWNEDGLPQLLIPAVALGLILVGWSVIEARRPKTEFPFGDGTPPRPPGRWFPYALGVIIVLQFAWLTYWRLGRP